MADTSALTSSSALSRATTQSSGAYFYSSTPERCGSSPLLPLRTVEGSRSRRHTDPSCHPRPAERHRPPSPSAIHKFRVWTSHHVPVKVYDCVDALPYPVTVLAAPLLLPPSVREAERTRLREIFAAYPLSTVLGEERAGEGESTLLDLLAPYDRDNPHHLALLQQLWYRHHAACYEPSEGQCAASSSPPFREVDGEWSSPMGFQQEDPTTDFRGGGVLSLAVLLLYVTRFPKEWAADVAEERRSGYFPAATSINISFWLSVQCGLRSTSSGPGKGNIVTNGIAAESGRVVRAKREKGFRSLMAKYRLVEYVLLGVVKRQRDAEEKKSKKKMKKDAKKEKKKKKKGEGEPFGEETTPAPPEDEVALRTPVATASSCPEVNESLNSPTLTPLDRLVIVHAAYLRCVRRAWIAADNQNLMIFNSILKSVYDEMDSWWLRSKESVEVLLL